MNGQANGVAAISGPVGDPDIVKMLEDALVRARSGQVVACALVLVGGGGMNAMWAGGHPAEINLGCDAVKASALSTTQQRPSSILRAR